MTTWIVAGLRHEPAALASSRQPLPTLDRHRLAAASGVAMGGYVLADAPSGEPDVILLATGSEVALALAARDELAADRIRARVVNTPWLPVEQLPAPGGTGPDGGGTGPDGDQAGARRSPGR